MAKVYLSTRQVDTLTYVNLRIDHPMETGLRSDTKGVSIPPWYLTELVLWYKDETVATVNVGPVMSRNPAFNLLIEGAEEGDELKVTWKDSRQLSGERSIKISA